MSVLSAIYDIIVSIGNFVINAFTFIGQAIEGALSFFTFIPTMFQAFYFASGLFHPVAWAGISFMFGTLLSLVLWKVVSKLF